MVRYAADSARLATSAASVPLALDAAVDEGAVSDGDAILLMGFGGGLSWASAVAIWR